MGGNGGWGPRSNYAARIRSHRSGVRQHRAVAQILDFNVENGVRRVISGNGVRRSISNSAPPHPETVTPSTGDQSPLISVVPSKNRARYSRTSGWPRTARGRVSRRARPPRMPISSQSPEPRRLSTRSPAWPQRFPRTITIWASPERSGARCGRGDRAAWTAALPFYRVFVENHCFLPSESPETP